MQSATLQHTKRREMITQIWQNAIYIPIVNGLFIFYHLLGNSLGWAIVAVTVLLRVILLPISMSSLKSARKMKLLQPKLEKLKANKSIDKAELAKIQMNLYKKNGVNPAAGCLPWIVQIIVLLALFRVFEQVLSGGGIETINNLLYAPLKLNPEHVLNTRFFYLDLGRPDLIKLPGFFGLGEKNFPGLFLLAAAAAQFFSSKIMLPQVKAEEKMAKKTETKEDDMAMSFQKNMVYMMPVMTIFIGYSFHSGLVLYWLTFSVFMLIQQVFIKRADKRKE